MVPSLIDVCKSVAWKQSHIEEIRSIRKLTNLVSRLTLRKGSELQIFELIREEFQISFRTSKWQERIVFFDMFFDIYKNNVASNCGYLSEKRCSQRKSHYIF